MQAGAEKRKEKHRKKVGKMRGQSTVQRVGE